MFSLVITVISIALVAALMLAVLYYGGGAMQKGVALTRATEHLNQSTQVLAAMDLFKVDHGRYPLTMQELVDNKYLKAIPSVYAEVTPSLASPAFASEKAEWVIPKPGAPVAWVQLPNGSGLTSDVCRTVNLKARDYDGILKRMQANPSPQCFGASQNALKVVVARTALALEEVMVDDPDGLDPRTAPPQDPADSSWLRPPLTRNGGNIAPTLPPTPGEGGASDPSSQVLHLTGPTPNAGQLAGGTVLQIGGRYLPSSGCNFYVDGVRSTTRVRYDMFAAPPGSKLGPVDVRVECTGYEPVTLPSAYTYLENIQIQGSEPAFWNSGLIEPVTLLGSGFYVGTSKPVVKVGGTTLNTSAITVLDSNRIRIVPPAKPSGTYSVSVTNPNGDTATRMVTYQNSMTGDLRTLPSMGGASSDDYITISTATIALGVIEDAASSAYPWVYYSDGSKMVKVRLATSAHGAVSVGPNGMAFTFKGSVLNVYRYNGGNPTSVIGSLSLPANFRNTGGLFYNPYDGYYYAVNGYSTAGYPVIARFSVSSEGTPTLVETLGSAVSGKRVSSGGSPVFLPDGTMLIRANTSGYELASVSLATGEVELLALSSLRPSGYSLANVHTHGFAGDADGNIYLMQNAQIIKYPRVGNLQYGLGTPIVGRFNVSGNQDGVGSAATIYTIGFMMGNGPSGEITILDLYTASGDSARYRVLR